MYHLRNPHPMEANRTRKLGLRDAKLVQNFSKKLAGMDRGKTILRRHDTHLPMVVDNFHIERIAPRETKAQAPLVIDAYAVLTRTRPPHYFKAI